MQERLQKIIPRAGIASRRAGEEIITAGRVRVNGRIVTELGAKADLGADTIEVDGRRLVPEAARYLVLHKPRGVVSTLADPEGRPTVVSLLEGAGTRLYPVGRLDFATSGVLLVTNDGDFANALLHPRGGVPKSYVVKTKGEMTDADLERWATGIQLEDGKTLPADIHFLRHEDGKTWFEVTLREGRNQQIRRMGEASGFPVMRLARTSFAGITSEGLRPGQWRSLNLDELLALRQQFGVPKKVRGAAQASSADAGDKNPRRVPRVTTSRPSGEGRPSRPTDKRGHDERGPRRAPAATEGRRPNVPPERGAREMRHTRPERAEAPAETRAPRREAPRRDAPRREERPTRGSSPNAHQESAPRGPRRDAPRREERPSRSTSTSAPEARGPRREAPRREAPAPRREASGRPERSTRAPATSAPGRSGPRRGR
jgi:23S rRNA pseudouridine2605 synthase